MLKVVGGESRLWEWWKKPNKGVEFTNGHTKKRVTGGNRLSSQSTYRCRGRGGLHGGKSLGGLHFFKETGVVGLRGILQGRPGGKVSHVRKKKQNGKNEKKG